MTDNSPTHNLAESAKEEIDRLGSPSSVYGGSELVESFETLVDELTPTPAKRITPPAELGPRDRGILTSSDREFLCGDWTTDSDFPQQVRSNNKARIRERTINAFRDLPLLLALDADQREQIFAELGRTDVRAGLGALVAFTYLASGKDRELIEDAAADGIFTAEKEVPPADPEKGEVRNVSVSASIDFGPNIEDIYQRFKEDGPGALSAGEIGMLVQESMLSTEELAELNKPEDVRRAEADAAEIQEAIEESDAATYTEWKETVGASDSGGTQGEGVEIPEGVFLQPSFNVKHPEKDIREFLDDDYVADR